MCVCARIRKRAHLQTHTKTCIDQSLTAGMVFVFSRGFFVHYILAELSDLQSRRGGGDNNQRLHPTISFPKSVDLTRDKLLHWFTPSLILHAERFLIGFMINISSSIFIFKFVFSTLKILILKPASTEVHLLSMHPYIYQPLFT